MCLLMAHTTALRLCWARLVRLREGHPRGLEPDPERLPPFCPLWGLGPTGGLRPGLWNRFELLLTDTLLSRDSVSVCLSQMFRKHHRTSGAAVGGAGA